MSRCVEADDLTKLEYAVAHHTQSNPPENYQVKDLTDLESLKTGFFPIAWGTIGLPEDFTGQEFGSMVMIVKFTRTIGYYVLFPWDGNYVWFARYHLNEKLSWKRLAFQE